jgi:hypothetical protein
LFTRGGFLITVLSLETKRHVIVDET